MLQIKGYGNVRALAFDLDGTLLNAEHVVSFRTKKAIQSLKEKYQIALISARPLRSIKGISKEIGIGDFLVASNGAHIADSNGHSLVYQALSVGIINTLINTLQQIPGLAYNFYEREQWFAFGDESKIAQEVKILGFEPTIMNLSDLSKHSFEKLLIICDPNEENTLIQTLQTEPKLFAELNICFSKRGFCEVNLKSVSKGSALSFIAEKTNVPLIEWIAFGDAENDIPMIKVAGYGVAMGNAHESLKMAASKVIGHHNADGIGIFLEELINSAD